MAFPWPNHAVRPQMLLAGAITLAGMAADGTNNFGPVAAGSPLDFEVWRGVHEIATNTTITKNIRFAQGGMIKPAAGVKVQIHGRIWADPTQHIFDIAAGGQVVGPFGNCARSPCWWGAVGDYDGSEGTNNYAAMVACAAASHQGAGVKSRIVVPIGNFFIEGPIRPAIANPAHGLPGQPQHLSEAGIIQLYVGDVLEGEAIGGSYLTIGNATAGDGMAVPMGGVDSSGVPTVVRNLFISGEYGGAYGLDGAIGMWANGSIVDNVWINGVGIGIHMDSTDQFLGLHVVEYCYEGVRVSRGANNIDRGTAYLCGNSYVIDHRDAQGETHINGVRCNNRNGGLAGGYGIVATGLYTRLKVVNADVEASPGGGRFTDAFAAFYTMSTQWVNCRAVIVGNHNGFSIAGVPKVQVANCSVSHVVEAGAADGTSTSNAALRVYDGASNVSIIAFESDGAFYDHILVNTAGRDIEIIGGKCRNGLRNGLRVLRCTYLSVIGGSYLNNAGGGIYDQIEAGVPQVHVYQGVAAERAGAGTQPYGWVTKIDDAGGRFRVSGGSALGNGSGAFNHTGIYNAANTNQIKISAETIVA